MRNRVLAINLFLYQFSFDIFGFLAPDVVDLLQRVQKIIQNNVVSSRSMDVIFKRIDFAIQKELARYNYYI
jgi:hypothetical protein